MNLYLNHIIRRYAVRSKNIKDQRIDPLDQRNWSNIDWIDRDNQKKDPDYQPDILIDPTNPEDLLIAKETLELAYDHFSQTEIDYLMGEMDLTEVSEISGINCEAFRRQLDRRKVDFISCMKILDQ